VARLHRDILRTLLGRIAAGDPPVGAKLPKEVDLAAELGASRGVVRECIRALEERGVVRVTHGHGAAVEPVGRWDVLDAEVLAVGGARLTAEAHEAHAVVAGELAALAAARSGPPAVLGGELARRAAERPAPPLERLEAAVAAVEAAAAADTGVAADPDVATDGLEAARRLFDDALAEAAGNRPLARVAGDLAAALGGPAPARADRYRRVLDAVRAGDPAAARAAMAAITGARPR
jgi:DNA-binding FadR family transcriptional regulator